MQSAILVVDDEPSVYESIRRIFKSSFRVLWARGVVEASAAIRHGTAAVIVDMRLDGENGYDVVAHLRALYPDLAIVVLSGYLDVNDVVKMARLGVRVFISKPFDVADLTQAVVEEIERMKRPSADDLEIARWVAMAKRLRVWGRRLLRRWWKLR